MQDLMKEVLIHPPTLVFDPWSHPFLKYRKKRNVEQVFQPYKVFRLNDMGGPEDSFREWCLQDSKDIDTSKSFNFRNSKEEYLFGNEEDK